MKRWVLLLGFAACDGPSPVAPEAEQPPKEMSAAARFLPARKPTASALLEAPARAVGTTPGRTALSVQHRARVVRFLVAPGDAVGGGRAGGGSWWFPS